MTSSLNLYVSSNGTDHGPLSTEEATKRVASGEFKPDDLSWHQGVSGWMPLKSLPEWPELNKKSAPPPLVGSKNLESTNSKPKLSKSAPKINLGNRSDNKHNSKSSNSFHDAHSAKPSMGIVGKLLITFAVIIFLSTLALVGYLIYQNIDKFIPPNNEPVEKTIEPEVSNLDPNETKEEDLINLPDPFAAPDQ